MVGGSFGGGPDKDDSIRTDGAASSKSEGAAYTYVGFTPLWTFRTTPRATPQPAGYESQPAAGCEPIFSSPAVSTAAVDPNPSPNPNATPNPDPNPNPNPNPNANPNSDPYPNPSPNPYPNQVSAATGVVYFGCMDGRLY